MREALQEILADRQLLTSRGSVVAGASVPRGGDHQRRALSPGTHFEVNLRDADLMWKGRVDMLILSEEGCSISDIKTGQPDDSHQLQLQIYALLWSGDSDLNHRQTPVISLQVGYGAGVTTVEVPTRDESSVLRADLLMRTLQIRQELSLPIVPAKPCSANCGYCQVKLLCDDFWIIAPTIASPADRFRHIELVLTRQESDSVWVATTTSLEADFKKSEVFVKRPSERVSFWAELKPGFKLRLTDAMVTYGQPDAKPLISITAITEPLLIPAEP
ncbi:PD-(D/E)XK nuclease family protein [Tunturiibacter psychrotolerans]